MHKVFLPWLINKRAKLGLKSCMVGTSSVSEVMPMIGFGVTYTASKAMSSYVGRALNWEVKNSKHADFFSRFDYWIYILYMLLLTIKFLPNFKIFRLTISNIYWAIKDSQNNKYSCREEHQ